MSELPKPESGAAASRQGNLPEKAFSPEAGDEAEPCAETDFEKTVLCFYEDVFRYAYRLSRNLEDASDLSQQTYLLAGRKIHQLRDVSRCRSWLLSIVRTCFLKSIQRRRPSTATDLDFEMQQQASTRQESALDLEAVELALEALPESDRLILLMFYFEELPYKTIAHQLDIPIGTVMSRLSRAKQRMRQCLESRDGGLRDGVGD